MYEVRWAESVGKKGGLAEDVAGASLRVSPELLLEILNLHSSMIADDGRLRQLFFIIFRDSDKFIKNHLWLSSPT